MLLQSHDGAVHLLPALPDAWATGSVQGLVARGGFVVDMNWNGVQLDKAKIHSRLGGNLRLRSYVPLRGVGLKEAKGKNLNEYYMQAEIKALTSENESLKSKMPKVICALFHFGHFCEWKCHGVVIRWLPSFPILMLWEK